MIYYKGHGVTGAGTIASNYQRERANYKRKLADNKMYQEMAEREISGIVREGKDSRFNSRLDEIDQIFKK